MVRKHRDYDNDYPSVTTVLGVLRNIPLEFWFKKNTLEFCNREAGKGKAIGTDIHKSIENYILTGQATVETEYPDEVTCALHSFIKFRKEHHSIDLKWSEQALTNEEYKYNGTIDCVGSIKTNLIDVSLPIILDWKSGKAGEKDMPDIYDSYKIQVSAYVYLWNYGKKMSEAINDAIIVSIAKDKVAYNTYKMEAKEISDCFNEVFLPSLRIWNYQHRKSDG